MDTSGLTSVEDRLGRYPQMYKRGYRIKLEQTKVL